MKLKTIFFILLGLLIIGFVGYWVYMENTFSKEILQLQISGPTTAKVGDEIEYTVEYKNTSNVVLQSAQLIFDMPDNSLTEDGKTRITQDLKDIYPGDEESVKIKTRLLGKEEDLKTAKAALSYTPKNLTVRYESDASFVTKIDTVPMTLDFDMPSKAESGKDFQYSINYFSNVDYPLENLSLKIDPVSGFDFVSSDPSSLDNTEWKLATLNKAQGGRITIKGNISGNTNQNLTFSVSLGMWQNGSFIVIKQVSQNVQVIQPLISISQQVNGSSSYIASPGETLNYQIFFRNISSSPSSDLSVAVKLDGNALDLSSVKAPDGQVEPNDNMIVWSSQQDSQLNNLNIQQQGEVDFSVKVENASNVEITDEVDVQQVAQKFTIKVNSGLTVSQGGYFKDPDISNSGPVPPQVGNATTYTITWNVKNYFSDTNNVKVKAILPENVSLTGKILPSDEASNFSFDSASREIVWSVGDVPAGTGVTGDPLTLSFQISLTPTASQKGSAASLIGSATASGENQFTNTIISANAPGIDTSLPDDFGSSGGGIVQ